MDDIIDARAGPEGGGADVLRGVYGRVDGPAHARVISCDER